jgi:site-specific DNA-adenine methylase
MNIGKGVLLFSNLPKTHCILNDSNRDVVSFYKNLDSPELIQQISICAKNWQLLSDFCLLSAHEIYISFIDFVNNIITQEDIQHMVRAIVLMNTDIEKFQELFSNNFVVSHDMFINALIKAVVNQLSKLKSTTGTCIETEIPDSFVVSIETAFKTGYFNHFQNLINWQNTDLIDCIDEHKHLAIWFFISKTSKGNKVIYDENGNLKNQYGGVSFNTIDFKKSVETIQSDLLKQVLKKSTFYNLPFAQFLKTIEPTIDDFILADLRTVNQFAGTSPDFKQHNTYTTLIKELNLYKSKWMVLTEYDCLLLDLVDKFGLRISKQVTDKTEIAILTNYP